MLCSSCGHDNPRENRYCGMCGTPFPHRSLPVPKEQSVLTFPTAPIEIASAPLAVVGPEPLPPQAPLVTATVEEVLARCESADPAAAVVPPESPAIEPEPVAEIVADNLAPEKPHPAVALSTELPLVMLPAPPAEVHPAPTLTVSREELPPHTSFPEIRRYATPHRETPPTHVDAGAPAPSSIQRPPAPQSLEPPPDSAGMPTFQSVAEASGAPPISPFEPPVTKDTDEERELQEFVASFRYQPPQEAVDELTMRSEVPVLDAEAPVTASHPSFDDDVPPPPEAGPHPTGEEYYPPAHASADRSHYLEIADTHRAAPSHAASTTSTTSFLGLDDNRSSAVLPPDELTPPVRRHWWLWSSLAVLLGVFGTLGYFEGRAQRNHAYQGPIEIIQEQYAKLRQRASELAASAPATNKPVAEAPVHAEPQTKPPATANPTDTTTQSQSESSANPNPPAATFAQPKAEPEKQPKPTTSTAQTIAAPDNKTAASAPPATVIPQKPAVDMQPKPSPAATEAKHEPIKEPPPAAAKPKSRPDPGQEELAKAMEASDPAAAAAWLWKATSRGNPVAPVRLADMFIKGKGVPHSCEQALVLLRSEAAKENAPARNRLAALYTNGTCVARDRVKAYQLMSSALAVDPTSEWAEQNRKELWQQMTPEERSQAEKYR